MRLFDLHKSFTGRVLAALTAAGEGGAGAGGGTPSQGTGGGAPPAFAETLPEDIRGDASFRDIKDLPGLARSFVNAQKMLGNRERLVQLPKDDKDAEGYTAIYKALGLPEAADKYDIPKRANGDYGESDIKLQKALLPVLHEAGITQRQLAAIVPKWNEIVSAQMAEQETATATARDAATKALKTELGTAYDEKLALARGALTHYAGELKLGDQVLADLDATKLGNSPGLFKLLAHLGGQLKEDGLIGKAEGGGHAGALSPAEAKQQISAMERDKDKFAIMRDRKHPQHEALMAERARLYEMAYPGEAA